MLVLNRKINEGFIVNNSIELDVIAIHGYKVIMELSEEGKEVKTIKAIVRGKEQKVAVGNSNMFITALHTSDTIARLGFEAPRDVYIARKELLNR